MPREPLRAALLIDSTTVPAWAYEAIRRVAGEGHARWTLVLLNGESTGQPSGVKRLWQSRRTALASAYLQFDQFISPADRDPLAPCDVTKLLLDVPQLPASDNNIASIESHALDVIVNFSSYPPSPEILAASKFGVWTFHYGDQADNTRPEFNGLRQVIDSQDVNRTTLEMLTCDHQNVTIAEMCSAVDRLSAARNRSNLYWPSVGLLPRQLARLHHLGPEKFYAEITKQDAAEPSPSGRGQGEGVFGNPLALSNHKIFPGLARLALRRLKRKWTKQLYRDQWFMLSHFDSNSIPSPLGRGQGEGADGTQSTRHPHPSPLPVGEGVNSQSLLESFQPIIPPIDRFWADPHITVHDGKPCVFFEEYLYSTGKAHISVMEFDDRGAWQTPQPVLERPYHLSYPFLFHWQDELFMIPETSANRTLEVYRCDKFPDRWSLHKTLMQGVNAFDATLVQHAGLWWIFVTLAETGGSSWDELFLFHADHPLSDHWMPHPANPIVSDVRRARPAGPLFMKDGFLHRPAQDCSRTYGYGIRLHRIEELSPTRYAETEVGRLEPLADRGWLATHTLSSAGGLTMIDAQRRRFKFGGQKPSPNGRWQGEGAESTPPAPSPQPSP